jgi:hypothetical protein
MDIRRMRQLKQVLRSSMSSTIAEQLRMLLDRDAETTGIVTSRNGLINRKHYARLIGITQSGLGQTYKHILTSYEDRHEIATGPITKLNEMREWLERAYSTGDLVIRDGRVDRLACMQEFAIKGGAVFTRHPEIRALFEEFDRRVAEVDYLAANRRAEPRRIKCDGSSRFSISTASTARQ